MRITDESTEQLPKDERESENKLEESKLSTKERTKAQFKREKQVWSSLSFGGKISYFFMYYFKGVLIAIAAIAIIVASIIAIRGQLKPHSLYFALINSGYELSYDISEFESDYRAHYDIPENLKIKIFPDYKIYADNTEIANVNGNVGATDIESLCYLMKHSQLDAVLTDMKGLEIIAECNYAPDFDIALEERGIDCYKPYYITMKDHDGFEYVAAIDVSGSATFAKLHASYTEVYLMIGGQKEENINRAIELLEYLMPQSE